MGATRFFLVMKWVVSLNLQGLTPHPLVSIRKVSSEVHQFINKTLSGACWANYIRLRPSCRSFTCKFLWKVGLLVWNYFLIIFYYCKFSLCVSTLIKCVFPHCREWPTQPAMGSGVNGLHRWREVVWRLSLSAVQNHVCISIFNHHCNALNYNVLQLMCVREHRISMFGVLQGPMLVRW